MIAAVGLASRPTRSRSAMFEPHPASIQDRDGGGPLLPYPLLAKTRWMKGKMRRETPSRARGLSVQSTRRRARRRTSGKSYPMVASRSAAAATGSRPHDIEDAVDDLAHRPRARPARCAGLRQVRCDHAPLSAGQIALVSGDGAAMLLSSSWRPHAESKVGSRNPLESRRHQ
jgi:hypothetical protein